MSENRQKTSKTGGFWRFFRVRSNHLRESGCRVSKTEGFLRFFFWSGAPLSGKTRVECQKLVGFLRFWGSRNCPENCAHDSFCLIRPFFRERKNDRKSPKNVKNWGFLAIFSCSKQPSAGIRLSSVKNWVFFAILVCPNLCSRFVLPHTAFSRPCPKVKRGGFRGV